MSSASPPDPGRYAREIAVMREMGWSWQDLMSAPVDLVEEILVRAHARERWQAEKNKNND